MVDIWNILIAISAYGIYSSFWKWNPLSWIVQSLITGAGLALYVDFYTRSFLENTWDPFLGGDLTMLGPMILGACYFTFFIPQLRRVYRSVLVLNLATSMGVSVPLVFSMVWTWVTGYAQAATGDIGRFVAMVALALCIINFTFSKLTEAPLRMPRTIGRTVLFVYAATVMTMCFVSNSNMLMYNSIYVWNSDAWFVPVLIFVGIIIDAVGGFNFLKRKPVTVEA